MEETEGGTQRGYDETGKRRQGRKEKTRGEGRDRKEGTLPTQKTVSLYLTLSNKHKKVQNKVHHALSFHLQRLDRKIIRTTVR